MQSKGVSNMQRSMVIIFGPTGVGKSAAAELLAESVPSEIINMDVGQFYVPLTIGTAKPAWQQSPIPHRLFDIIHEPRSISVAEYRDTVITQLESAWSLKRLPILVGGSGFYLMSLFYPPRAGSGQEISVTSGTWQELNELDPERAKKIHPHDTYRINRALAIVKSTGKKSSMYRPIFEPIAPFTLIEFVRERPDLYDRINTRTVSMIEQGWLDEVARLRNTPWEDFLKQKKLIGYDDILHYFEGPQTTQERTRLIQVIQQKTRHYAKRQMTFGRMLFSHLAEEQAYISKTESSLHVFNLTLSPVNLYINQLLRNPLISRYHL